jgi:hypothetical protein
MGKELETMVRETDKTKLDIVSMKKESYRGLTDIRDVMKCDVGKDQREHKPDFRQADHMLGMISNKD